MIPGSATGADEEPEAGQSQASKVRGGKGWSGNGRAGNGHASNGSLPAGWRLYCAGDPDPDSDPDCA